jgi:hypothetical protein
MATTFLGVTVEIGRFMKSQGDEFTCTSDVSKKRNIFRNNILIDVKLRLFFKRDGLFHSLWFFLEQSLFM